MSPTLIIGANGQIGRILVQLMLQQQLPVRAMVRSAEQADFFIQLGADVVIADLEQPLPAAAFADCDQVVFTAGSGSKTGPDKTILIDLWGACKAIEMAKSQAVKQFIMVSAQNAGDPDNGNPAIKPYNVCKHFADQYLLGSGLPFTILRPGRLINDAATGKITTQRPTDKAQRQISRTDVAQCIIQCLTHNSTVNHIKELYQGDLPISQVLI